MALVLQRTTGGGGPSTIPPRWNVCRAGGGLNGGDFPTPPSRPWGRLSRSPTMVLLWQPRFAGLAASGSSEPCPPAWHTCTHACMRARMHAHAQTYRPTCTRCISACVHTHLPAFAPVIYTLLIKCCDNHMMVDDLADVRSCNRTSRGPPPGP